MQVASTESGRYPLKKTARVIAHPASLLASPHHDHRSPSKISLPLENGTRFINTADIAYCQAQSNYAFVVLVCGERILLSKTLKWVQERLPDHAFIRVHGSYLVQLEHITFAGKHMIKVLDDIDLPISRSRKPEVVRAIECYCTMQR